MLLFQTTPSLASEFAALMRRTDTLERRSPEVESLDQLSPNAGGTSTLQGIQDNGADQTQRPVIDFIAGTGITLSYVDDPDNNRIKITISATGASATFYSASIAFTDGDTMRRVTITNGSVGATSKIVGTVRRPNSADDSADAGYTYIANVVKVASGSFDVVIVALRWDASDAPELPPNETIEFIYSIG